MTGPAQAEMMPLRQTMEGGAEASYAAIRCAVLYLAPVAYAGTDRFDEEVVAIAIETFSSLTDAAVAFRIEASGGSADIVGAAVLADAKSIIDHRSLS